ncbi:MAG TPA: alpha/beta fold hydrolase [Candidatus Dormibacteraeota bacterium]
MSPGDVIELVVLVHSPSVGPSTWEAVAHQLRKQHIDVIVPSLREVADADPPSGPIVLACVRSALRDAARMRPLTVVVHSNAGYFAPILALDPDMRVTSLIFVDASLPSTSGSSALAQPELLAFLRDQAIDGVLPPWTTWWPDEEAARLFPDRETMRRFQRDEPRLPLAYYEQAVPAPAGWDDRHCAFLLYSDAYAPTAEVARGRGWPVEAIAGEHLHMLVDPAATANAIIRLAQARNH